MAADDSAGILSQLTGGVAAVAAVLATTGISGAALLRAVRTHPTGSFASVAAALAGAAIIVMARLARGWNAAEGNAAAQGGPPGGATRAWHRDGYFWTTALGAAVLLGGLAGALLLGTSATGQREQPMVTLQETAVPDGSDEPTVELTVIVHAHDLAPYDDAAVQVVGLPSLGSDGAIGEDEVRACETNRAWNAAAAPPALPGYVLSWHRMGPDPDGSIRATYKLRVPVHRYAAVCAWTIYSHTVREWRQHTQVQSASAYLRLSGAPG